MAAAAASRVPRFKAVLFGLWCCIRAQACACGSACFYVPLTRVADRGVVTMPAQRASEHVRRWEATKGLPSGFLLARSAVEGGAVHLVLDGAPPSNALHADLLALERWRNGLGQARARAEGPGFFPPRGACSATSSLQRQVRLTLSREAPCCTTKFWRKGSKRAPTSLPCTFLDNSGFH